MTATVQSPDPSATAGTPAFECRDLSTGHGRLTVVRGFELVAGPGEVVALLGPNGAGKTTLLNCIAGYLPRHGGDVRVDGRSLPDVRPTVAVRRGVGFVPDDRSLFSKLTVAENLEVARVRGGASTRSVLEMFPALERRWNLSAGNLSGGEQQMLALARTLLRRPRVLLIDEMSMGLAPLVVEGLMPLVRQVADETGAVVVLVEQHVRLALEVADRAIVLVHGEIRVAGSAAELSGDLGRIEAAYLGTEDLTDSPNTRRPE